MNKQLVLFGLIAAFAVSVGATFAADDNITIYKDGIGRIHFLGKDPQANKSNYSYANPAAQDLTRKLYEETKEVNNDTSFDQHPLKNYENTFSDFRFTNYYKRRYQYNPDTPGQNNENREGRVGGSFTAEKGASEHIKGVNTQYNPDVYSASSDGSKNVISDTPKKAKKAKKEKKNKKK